MDYSQMASEESSPWNTSPQVPRYSASASGSEPPSPAIGISSSRGTTEDGNSDIIRPAAASEPPKLDVGQPASEAPANGRPSDLTAQTPVPARDRDGQVGQNVQQQQQVQGQPQGQQSQPPQQQQPGYQGRPQPARYQTGARAAQRNTPQYKLQTKITALERTGKKDIILRFDAQVGS